MYSRRASSRHHGKEVEQARSCTDRSVGTHEKIDVCVFGHSGEKWENDHGEDQLLKMWVRWLSMGMCSLRVCVSSAGCWGRLHGRVWNCTTLNIMYIWEQSMHVSTGPMAGKCSGRECAWLTEILSFLAYFLKQTPATHTTIHMAHAVSWISRGISKKIGAWWWLWPSKCRKLKCEGVLGPPKATYCVELSVSLILPQTYGKKCPLYLLHLRWNPWQTLMYLMPLHFHTFHRQLESCYSENQLLRTIFSQGGLRLGRLSQKSLIFREVETVSRGAHLVQLHIFHILIGTEWISHFFCARTARWSSTTSPTSAFRSARCGDHRPWGKAEWIPCICVPRILFFSCC